MHCCVTNATHKRNEITKQRSVRTGFYVSLCRLHSVPCELGQIGLTRFEIYWQTKNGASAASVQRRSIVGLLYKKLIRIKYFTEARKLLFRRKYMTNANWPVKSFLTVQCISRLHWKEFEFELGLGLELGYTSYSGFRFWVTARNTVTSKIYWKHWAGYVHALVQLVLWMISWPS